MTSRVYVAGVGMIPFTKPGANAPYPVMGAEATALALADAGVSYDMIQQAYVGYVYGDSTSGQRALYQVGMSGIPIINVNNNCSTGSTALYLARQAIESGAVDCVLALGFEQMKPGALGAVFTDRPSAFDDFDAAADKLVDAPGVPLALRYFGGAGLSHMKKYGTPLSEFAMDDFVLPLRHISPIFYDSIVAACHDAGISPVIPPHQPRNAFKMFCLAACHAGASPPMNPIIRAKIMARIATAGVILSANTTSLNVTAFEVPVCMPLKGSMRRMPTMAPSNASSRDSNTKEVRMAGREKPMTRSVAISRPR